MYVCIVIMLYCCCCVYVFVCVVVVACVLCVSLLCVSLSLLTSCLAVPSASLPVPLFVLTLLVECLVRCGYYYYYYLLIMLCADSVLCAACRLAVCAYSKPLCCLDDPTPQLSSLPCCLRVSLTTLPCHAACVSIALRVLLLILLVVCASLLRTRC